MIYRGILVVFLALAACMEPAEISVSEARAWLAQQPDLSEDWAIGCDRDGSCVLTDQNGAALVLKCNSAEGGCGNNRHIAGCVLVVRGCSALRPCRTYTIKPEDM